MGRIKSHTRKAYVGRRKMKSRQRTKAEVVSAVEVGPIVEPTDTVPDSLSSSVKPKVNTSASTKKLSAFGLNIDEMQKETEAPTDELEDCYLIVQKNTIKKFFNTLLCPDCKKPGLSFMTLPSGKCGFSIKAKVVCECCEGVVKEDYLCERVGGSKLQTDPFDINIRATLAFRGIGCGYSAMREWAGTMNMPHYLSCDAYTSAHKKIAKASSNTFKEIVAESRKAIVNAYGEIGEHPDDKGILNIAVSFDGSWQKRGYTSHNGLGAVVDLMTGHPIDYDVLSNFCFKCKAMEDDEENPEWKHKHSANCPKNFDGTAGAMEVACAERLWSRSVECHSLRYTTILSDGDSKAFDAVTALNVYGQDVTIEKEDCVNHVSKRMGTALRNLVATSKAQKDAISGKGKLTQDKMTKIQNYYGRAIKDHASDIQLLKKRIMAILMHLSSTDSTPKHMHCPPGEHSWCFWQRAIAQAKNPGLHREHDTLPPEVGKKLVPIFLRLSDEALLKRCVRNKTQNPNESFHNLVWKLCPKTIFVGRRTLETAVALAACQFSMGSQFKTILCKTLGLVPGENLERQAAAKSILRLRKAETANSIEAKKRRKQLKYSKHSKELKKKSKEGEQYAAGAFNC